MSDRLPELEELASRLRDARVEPARRSWRRRLPWPVLVVGALLVTTVPAIASRSLWAPLVGGETPVPPLTAVRSVLATGDSAAGPWRVEGYRARLRTGGFGDCLFLTTGADGSGTCLPAGQRSFVATHQTGSVTFVLVWVAGTPAEVTGRWADGTRQRANVHVARLPGENLRFAVLQRSGGAGAAPAFGAVVSPAAAPGPG